MQEQQPETKRQGEDQTNRHVPLRQPLTQGPHADPRRQCHQYQAPERRNADEDGPGGAGESDMRQSVSGKCLAAQHQKVADDPRDDRDHSRCRESIAHEIVLEHCPGAASGK